MPKKLNSVELHAKILLQKEALMEGVDSSGVKSLISSAADLYEEITDFEQNATVDAINALTPHLKSVKDMLENMIQNPTSYVPQPKAVVEKQRVTFKPSKDVD
jgi:hypothetical protein